jgi:hypothetical protein
MTADHRGEGIVNVLISHNHEDGEAAKTIKKQLSLYGANRFDFSRGTRPAKSGASGLANTWPLQVCCALIYRPQCDEGLMSV